jgi:hypothetical protein
VTGVWIKLHSVKLHNLYCFPNIIRVIKSRRIRWAGHVVHMGKMRNVYKILVRNPEGKRPLGRPKHRWEVNIKMDVREIGLENVDWIHLAHDGDRWWAFVDMVMMLWVP